jgi:hypothetical protein
VTVTIDPAPAGGTATPIGGASSSSHGCGMGSALGLIAVLAWFGVSCRRRR